jgi:hypothetical protein
MIVSFKIDFPVQGIDTAYRSNYKIPGSDGVFKVTFGIIKVELPKTGALRPPDQVFAFIDDTEVGIFIIEIGFAGLRKKNLRFTSGCISQTNIDLSTGAVLTDENQCI